MFKMFLTTTDSLQRMDNSQRNAETKNKITQKA